MHAWNCSASRRHIQAGPIVQVPALRPPPGQWFPADCADKQPVTSLPIGTWHSLERNAVPVRRPWSVIGWTLVLLTTSTALLGRLVYLIRPFDPDGAMFIYMGKLTSEGGRLCHDLIDNKFPTVGLMTSIPWRLFGPKWVGYVLLGAVLILISTMVLGRIARRHVGEHAVLPVILFGAVYLNFNPGVFGGFQLETLQVFFAVLAAAAAMEALSSRDGRDAFTVGLAAGCAAMLKPTGLAVVAAFIITLIVRDRREPSRALAPVAATMLGLLVPAAAVLSYLVAADILRDMPRLAGQISTYARESAWNWLDLFKPPTVAIILGFPFLIRGWVCRREVHRLDASPDRTLVWFIALWFALEAIGVISQRRMYAYHFLVLAPPAALLFGMIPRRLQLRPLLAALLPAILLSVYSAGQVIQYEFRGRTRLPASEYLLARTQPGDVVWQDEMMRLLIETNLRPGSRVPMGFLFANHDEAPLEYSKMILADFERNRPKYILLRRDFDGWLNHLTLYIAELERIPRRHENFIIAWKGIQQYVRERYLPEAQIERDTVWRRRD
jgi:hypothetical protein